MIQKENRGSGGVLGVLVILFLKYECRHVVEFWDSLFNIGYTYM